MVGTSIGMNSFQFADIITGISSVTSYFSYIETMILFSYIYSHSATHNKNSPCIFIPKILKLSCRSYSCLSWENSFIS